MDASDAMSAVSALKTDLSRLEGARQPLLAQIGKIDAQVAAMTKIIEGYYELHPELRDDTEAPPASRTVHRSGTVRVGGTRDQMRSILQSTGEWMTAREMLQALIESGWVSKSSKPITVVRNELASLAKSLQEMERNVASDHSVRYRIAPGTKEAE